MILTLYVSLIFYEQDHGHLSQANPTCKEKNSYYLTFIEQLKLMSLYLSYITIERYVLSHNSIETSVVGSLKRNKLVNSNFNLTIFETSTLEQVFTKRQGGSTFKASDSRPKCFIFYLWKSPAWTRDAIILKCINFKHGRTESRNE